MGRRLSDLGEWGLSWGYLDCNGGELMCGWRDSCHQGE